MGSHYGDSPMMAEHRQGGSGGGLIGLLIIVIGLLFAIGPTAAIIATDIELSSLSQGALALFGVMLMLAGAGLIMISRFWVKVPTNRAFIRTGRGGALTVIDGGSLFIPYLHEGNWVSLETIPLVVKREGADALFTNDKIRADVTASFYISIEKTEEAVRAAAAKLGSVANSRQAVQNMVGDIFDSALRQVAAEMNIADLMVNRQSFQQSVKQQVDQSIRNFGLVLSEVTISRMDQTPRTAMRGTENMFDAEGERRIAEKVSAERILTNQIELKADREIEEAQITTRQLLYQQRVGDEQAQAETNRSIAEIKAQQESLAAVTVAEQERISKTAKIVADQVIAVAEVERQQAEQVAKEGQQKAVETAQVDRQKALAVAERDKDIAIAAKETQRAVAESERLSAEATRQEQAERVSLVQVEAQANRAKVQSVVAAEADAKRREIDERTKADVAAYSITAQAQADFDAAERRANAKLVGARAEAESRTIQAEAEANALAKKAEGDRAVQMVPIDIEARRVEIHRAEVEVQRESLEAQSEHQIISRDLQVDLARIHAERDIEIERAKAQASAFAQANIQLWGTPDQVASIMTNHMRGQQVASTIQGFASNAPDGVMRIITALTETFAGEAAQKGISVDQDELLEKAKKAAGLN